VNERAWLVRMAALALVWAGGVEWLFGRVISRMAASPALEGVGRSVIEVIGRAGLFLISTAFLLALTLFPAEVLRLGASANRSGDSRGLAFATYLALFGVLLAVHAILSALAGLRDQAWIDITFNILSLAALVVAAVRAATNPGVPWTARAGVAVVAFAYGTWFYSVLGGAMAGAGGPQVPGTGGALLLGEAAALLVPTLFFLATSVPSGRWRALRSWTIPVLGALIFAAGNIADIAVDQGFTGVFTIWSVGFTLYLPWPFYALSLAFFLHALGTCFSRRRSAVVGNYANPDTGLGLLLLLYAGFYLQLTYQHLLALLAILLLGQLARPLSHYAESDGRVQAAMDSAPPAEQAEQRRVTT
jgi:hypothetical protein